MQIKVISEGDFYFKLCYIIAPLSYGRHSTPAQDFQIIMDKATRAKLIADHVLALDAKFGRTVPPRSPQSTSRTRLISDDPRWEARYSFDYEKDSAGETWDLLELWVYRQHRLTVVIRGDRVVPRFYIPGKWEPIFIDFDVVDTVPLLPN